MGDGLVRTQVISTWFLVWRKFNFTDKNIICAANYRLEDHEE